ncbi:dihydrofolate reductase family protein [Synechococcus sp. PCC 6312]|uniref:dihydrofolate reductase family protein n=1 Tax=Synechococcus sp. (strain ATCC 27167 / PCC 6312) TaxID=195253 RepID=UPI00029EEB89|nr:dihydrofolate reductase [Synechococcus sp. PCC 6312]
MTEVALICRVFIATSLDGFIARSNGALDWLPQTPEDSPDFTDYGYQAFMDSVDGVVLGRNTYELVKSFQPWPYGNRPVVVLSHHSCNVPAALRTTVTVMAAVPEQVVDYLSNQGIRSVYIDGGQTIQQFLRAGLIQDLIISRIPILLGEGIPLFGALTTDIPLVHQYTRSYDNGLVQSHYQVG